MEVGGRVGGQAEGLIGNGHVRDTEGERINPHLTRHHALAVINAEPVIGRLHPPNTQPTLRQEVLA